MIDGKPKKIRGRMRIGHMRGGDNKHHIRIDITDADSAMEICEITISPKQLMLALGSLADRPCKVSVFPNAVKRAGNVMEVRQVEVPMDFSKRMDGFIENKVPDASHLEVNGWKADIDKTFNSHRYNAQRRTYLMTFRRWVKKRKAAK